MKLTLDAAIQPTRVQHPRFMTQDDSSVPHPQSGFGVDSTQDSNNGAPAAPRHTHSTLRHGINFDDPYHWLQNRDDSAVRAYLEAENVYTAQQTANLQPLANQIYEELLGRIKQSDSSVPVTDGHFNYYQRQEEGKQYSIYCRRRISERDNDAAGTEQEQIVLDLNRFSEDAAFLSLGDREISPDGNYLAYTLDVTGFRQFRLYIKDLRTGELLPHSWERVTSVQWAADNRTILLTTEDEITKRSDTLIRIKIGSPAQETVYYEADQVFDLDLSQTRDRSLLILTISSKDTTEQRYLSTAEPDGEPTTFLPREKGHRYYIDHRDGTAFIRTNRTSEKPGGAIDFRIVTTEFGLPAPNYWIDFVPHEAGTLLEELDVFADFVVIFTKSEAIQRINIFTFVDQAWQSIPVSESVYHLGRSDNPDYHTRIYRYTFESLITPPTVYDFDVAAGKSLLRKQQEVVGGYDASDYVEARLWATVRDGTRVPISILYRKATMQEGGTPLLLYGYGSYGIGIDANFSSNRLSLLNRGIAFAIAHVRGGNELGEQWRQNGMLMKKLNTFCDFIDCAEWLVQQGWSQPSQLVVEGGSAGGLLLGVALNERPELFRAAHLAVPFVDVINTMFDPDLPLTTSEYLEWGNPNEAATFHYMLRYSPYDNLRPGRYPAILVTTSLNDSQVMYWEPAKYVAKLRTMQTGDATILLRTRMESAGHGGASGRYDRLREKAFEYAWIISQVGAGA